LPIFTRLKEQGAMPSVSGWVFAFLEVNEACFRVPALAIVPLLILADAAATRLARTEKWAGALYWYWFSSAPLSGLVALILVIMGLAKAISALRAVVQ
jgi:hypothetical protein